ncbi:hypothetical protein HD806DRAFT_547514 [Xylariaceae sp. AK1471]|nr:hypothetical protein HD806DRAFT_547514 [Xylariaceae sp. AK1471]
MTMAESSEQVITYGGEGIQLQVIVDNAGWSSLKPVLGFSSRSSRTHTPTPLDLPRTGYITEAMGTLKAVKIRLSTPTFDVGLGCFGNPSKLVETGRGELDRLWWADHKQLKVAQELIDGRRIWGDEEWIDFQLEAREEEDSSDSDVSNTLERSVYQRRTLGGQDLLEELDDLEAARPTVEKRQISIPGNREGIWEQPDFGASTQQFDDWVDEVAALEALASMPEGTRYYKVND